MHFTDFLLILNAEPLLPPFHLQEGKVGLIENKLCNMLYEHRFNEGKTSLVHEEMLCAGDFLTGKAICRVSEATSVLPLPALWASVSKAEPVLPLLPLWRPLGLLFPPSACLSWAPSSSSIPQASPFLSPSHLITSAGRGLKQCLFLGHI